MPPNMQPPPAGPAGVAADGMPPPLREGVVRAAIREDAGFDGAVLERIFRRSNNSLVRREVVMLLAVMRDFQRVTELVRANASMSGWDGRTLQYLRSMTGFDCPSVPGLPNAADPCAIVLERWLSGQRPGA